MKSQQSVLSAPVLIVTTVLCLLAALLGLRLGAEQAAISESDLIDAAVARWKTETGADDASSCFGTAPVESSVWPEVRCGMGEEKRVYRFDRQGKLLPDAGPLT